MEKIEKIVYDIKATPTFFQKLESIKNYYEETFLNNEIIEVLYSEIDDCIEVMKIFPYINASTILLENAKFRRCMVQSYIIVYEIDEDNRVVYLNNIYHHLEDYLSYYG